VLTRIRIWLPDAPGVLGAVAAEIGAVQGNVVGLEVLEREAGVAIEYGPGKHGIGEQSYLYFREPGGLRMELNTGGYRNYVPDWEPVHWPVSKGSNTMYRNHGMPDSMMEAFPPGPGRSVPDADLVPALAEGENPWKIHG